MTTDKQNRWANFGREIALRRRLLGEQRNLPFTQKELARRVKVTEKQISRLETAMSGTDYETVLKLAEALEYDESAKQGFFRLAGIAYPQSKQIKADTEVLNPNMAQDAAMEFYSSLNPELQHTVTTLLRTLSAADKSIQASERVASMPSLSPEEELLILNRNTGAVYNLRRERIEGDAFMELVTLLAAQADEAAFLKDPEPIECLQSSRQLIESGSH